MTVVSIGHSLAEPIHAPGCNGQLGSGALTATVNNVADSAMLA